MEQSTNVHTRKFYRIVLEEIDSSVETPETFALKLTLRLRMTTPRAKSIVRHLPCVLRSNMSAKEANRLKAVLEDIGGQCRLETHFVTPGEGRSPATPDSAERTEKERPEDETRDPFRFKCPKCGNEEGPDATFCSMCLRKFRDPTKRNEGLGARIPHDNPLGGTEFRLPDDIRFVTDHPLWQRYKWVIVGAVGLLVLLLLIVK
jgi:hypothetical protein